VTADERVRADDVADRKGPLARKSRFKTFWADPGPEGEATVMVESVWPMRASWSQSEKRDSRRYRSMGEGSRGKLGGRGSGVAVGWCWAGYVCR
jgi:hypothetical protein